MSTIEQRFRTNQETLAYLRSKENIQASIRSNPQYWKDLAIEEEVLKGLLARRRRNVKLTLDRNFKIFALVLFGLVAVCTLSLLSFQGFIQISVEQKVAELAMQLGLVSFSVFAFFKCLAHFRFSV